MPKSFQEVEAELKRKMQVLGTPGTASDNGGYPAAELRPRAEPSTSAKPQRPIGRSHDVGRIPPHSREAEMGVLGSILQDPRGCIPRAQEKITDEFFFLPQCRAMFNALLNFYEEVGGFNAVEFTTEMMQTSQDKAMGGAAFITEAWQFVPTGANIDFYLGILQDKYAAREIIRHCTASVRQAHEHSDDADYLLQEHEKRMEAIRVSVGAGHHRLPELCDISTLLGENQPEEPPELVKGVLHQGSKLVAGGSSKALKTMTLIDLAISVATGSKWWGFPCEKGPVCYINFEIQPAFFAKRVHAVCAAKGVTLPAGAFQVWNLRGYGEGIENIVGDLMAVLRHRNFVLIIIDPIYKALGDRDENKAGDVASMLNQLEKIAVKTGAAVAFGAHYSKGNQTFKDAINRIGGSGVFARDPDSILTMTAHQEEQAFTVDATLRNFAPIEPFVLRWEWPLFQRADDLDPEALKQSSSARAGQFKAVYNKGMLLDRLSVAQGIKPVALRRIMDEQHGMQKSAFYRYKDQLLSEGLAVEKDGELYRVHKGQEI